MRFTQFSFYLQKLEETTSRNEMTVILAQLFAKAEKEEIDKICYLSLGRLRPKFAGIEFNLAEKMMIRVLAWAFEREEKEVKKEFKKVGDLGEVGRKLSRGPSESFFFSRQSLPSSKSLGHRFATLEKGSALPKSPPCKKDSFGSSKTASFSVSEVYDKLMEIAQESGEGSVERKIKKMAQLLKSLDSLSVKYLVRIPLGRLRLGFSELTILDALSFMIAGDKSKRAEIEEAYNVQADVGQIAKIIKEKGIDGLKGIKISLGTPVMPALCQRLATPEEMIEKMGKVAVEPKYDGTRLQIHFSRKRKWEKPSEQLGFSFRPRGFVRIFTRNLENTTQMFPDLVEAVFQEVRAQEAILDGEAIGYDRRTGKFLPFQETIKRKRKYEVGKKAKEIPLKFFCFDLLYKDGQDLLKMPFFKRRRILEETLSFKNQTFIPSPQIQTENPRVLRSYHDEQIEKGLEGAVVKKWQAGYEPGRRGFTWVKFKTEKGKKGGGLADTLDCVVMGYYKGRGKRAGFGIGAFLVGVKKGEEFLTISKIGTGLTDQQWYEMRKRCGKAKTAKKPKFYQVAKELVPDVWCEPKLVVEIEADNITRSPLHSAGLALRFPRLVRFREDKSPSEVTTLSEAKKLFRLQKS